MAEPDWRQAEDVLFEESQKVIREFAQKHSDALLSLFAYTVDVEYSGVGINFDTPANSLRKAKALQRREIETRNRLFALDDAWKSAHYYYAAGSHGEIDDFNRRGPWQYEVVSFVPLAAWEQAWEEFCSNPPSDEDDEAGAKLEGRIIVSLWRVVDRLVRSDVFDVLKRATPFRIGYAFHDAKLVVLGIRNWPELASEQLESLVLEREASMAVTQVEVHELPVRFGELIALAAAGTEVLLTEGQVPRARLVPLTPPPRIAGLHRGAIQTTEDFDAPLPEDFWTGRP